MARFDGHFVLKAPKGSGHARLDCRAYNSVLGQQNFFGEESKLVSAQRGAYKEHLCATNLYYIMYC